MKELLTKFTNFLEVNGFCFSTIYFYNLAIEKLCCYRTKRGVEIEKPEYIYNFKNDRGSKGESPP